MEEDKEVILVKSFFEKAGIDLKRFPLKIFTFEETETKEASFDPIKEVDYNNIIAKAKYNHQENKDVLFCINNLVPEKIEENQVFTINVEKGGGENFSVELSLHHNSIKEIPIYCEKTALKNFVSKLSQIKFYREKMETSHTSYVKMKFGTRYILLPYLVIFK